jgi:hypothetical protein
VSTPAPAVFSFLPWVRRGASVGITQAENVTDTSLGVHASFAVGTTVNDANPATLGIQLYGPGDVVGFDPDQVIRTEPKPYTAGFEPNFLAAVEFDLPDFVWMMTPTNPQTGVKLRPWICLIVVPQKDGVTLAYEAGAPLPVLSIAANAGKELPNLAESWAWAHAQVTGDLGAKALDSVLTDNPERTLSRLVCPRRLEPDTAYYACVVPTTRAGREAGRGVKVATADLTPAWTSGDATLQLPVYFSWQFATGPAGDFESLARELRPALPPAGIGRQDIDISDAGIGLPLTPDAPGSTLGFEGALESSSTQPTPWPDPPRGQFRARLTELLDFPESISAQDPSKPGVVAPPLYGGFHTAQSTVPTGRPHWLRELNLDPRFRAAAGLGTRVVQEQQESLMESAWRQVGEIDKANDALRKAQLARATCIELHARHIQTLEPGEALQITSPAHARVLMSPQTLALRVRESALPEAALSTTLRRIVRPTGPVLRRSTPAAARVVRPLVRRLNSGEVAAAGPRHAPDGTVELDGVADGLIPGGLRALRPVLRMLFSLLLLVALALLVLALALAVFVSWGVAAIAFVAAAAAGGAATWVRARLGPWLEIEGVTTSTLTAESVAETPPRPAWQPSPADAQTLPPPPAATATGADAESAARFRAAAEAKQRGIRELAETQTVEAKTALQLTEARDTLLERLDPRVTVPSVVLGRITLPDGWEPDDPIATILAAPSFDTPMYEPLRELAKSALLPGVEAVATNTVTLLQTNARFIEAYMVGLNHEMSRELLWREFPTDQRGTYFRQFWDPRGHVPAPTTDEEREALRDIPAIHMWRGSRHLGENATRGGSPLLVLLICGELLERYPNTVIYASQANLRPNNAGRAPLDPPEERFPLFRGTFPSNITFVGFDLSVEEAKGGPPPRGSEADPGPGWFFVLQQQPTEPRFGFDEDGPKTPATWADLSWKSVAVRDDHVSVADTGAALTTAGSALAAPWATDAGALGVQTLQSPYRVAISADDML